MNITQPIINIAHLHKQHGLSEIFSLHMEGFTVQRGELVALVGPSGCGKSTALDMLSTALEPGIQEGSVFSFCPQDMPVDILQLWRQGKQSSLAALRRTYIGYILQTGGLLPFLNGYENIALCCVDAKHKEGIVNLAQILDITHLLQKKPAQMSVGERQRFAIARALVHEPKLILADEPVASLDPYNAQLVLELFTSIAQEKHISVVMVSHSPDSAKAAGFRLVTTEVTREEGQIYAHMGATTTWQEPQYMEEESPNSQDIYEVKPVGTAGIGSGTC